MITDIHSEDRLVQVTFADHLRDVPGWESIYAYNEETFGPTGTLGRANEREAVLVRDLQAAVDRLNPDLPPSARQEAVERMTRVDFSRSLIQQNKDFYDFIRNGVPVNWRDAHGQTHHARARVIDFTNAANNRFLAVRELKFQRLCVSHYGTRADLVCFVNGQHHVREGLSEEELTFFDMLLKDKLSKAEREKLKQASKGLLASLKDHLAQMPSWTKNATTQADVQMFILDNLYAALPRPPFTDEEAEALSTKLYGFVFQQSERGQLMAA